MDEERVAQSIVVRDINRSRDIAKQIDAVRKRYELKGDFSIIDRVLKKTDTDKQKLSTFLHTRWSADYAKLRECGNDECQALRVFATSEVKKFVGWLRNEVTTMRDFRTLIQVASAVSGENDQEVIRVHTLDSAVNGYETLIYNVMPEHGFAELFPQCRDVFTHLRKEPKLANQLKDASGEMSWLESLTNIRASVELTSVKELDLINDYGNFQIRFDQDAVSGRSLVTPLGVHLNIRKDLAVRDVTRAHPQSPQAQAMDVDRPARRRWRRVDADDDGADADDHDATFAPYGADRR